MKDMLLGFLLLAIGIMFGFYILAQKIPQVSNQNGTLLNAISVQGQQVVSLKPNVTSYSFSDSEKNLDGKVAQTEVNQKINQVRDILKNSGIKDEDITSSNISLSPNYEYSSTGSTQNGFVASHTLQVKFRDFDLASKIIDQASSISGININSLGSDIEDKDLILGDARVAAFKKAKQKAQEMANMAGVQLDKIISISESSDSYSPRPVYMMAKADMAGSDSTSINPGTQDTNVYINITYSLK